MPKRLEHIEAAKAEAIRLGATIEIINGGKHYIGVLAYNGKIRKTSLSLSPSDHRVCGKVRQYIRKMIREMAV
jgi:hypothetical protein